MKKIYISSSILIVVIGLYLFVAHVCIYKKIGDMALPSTQTQKTYSISNNYNAHLTYVALGDSLTSGVGATSYVNSYPYQFAQYASKEFNANITLVPLAIPGARTEDVISSLLPSIIDTKPDIVTILLGVNDIHNGVSKDEFEKNYRYLIEQIKQNTSAQIYIINIPYIGLPSLILPPYSIYFDMKTVEFNSILHGLKDEYKVSYIDLYTLTQSESKNKTYYSADLFHPSDSGYTLWAKIIYDNFYK